MDNRERGLYGKFFVHRVDGRDAPGGDKAGADYFILDLTHDKYAWTAMMAYMGAIRDEYPLLFADLQKKAIAKMQADATETPKPPSPQDAMNFRVAHEMMDSSWLPSDVWKAWERFDHSTCWLSHPPGKGWVIVQCLGNQAPTIVWMERSEV